MSLYPLNRVLNDLKQTHWQEQQQFDQLVRTWSEVVGAVVAAQTRPVQLLPQRVLKVATSSSVWSQNLAFERHRILAKLNQKLPQPISDIRFSNSQWYRRTRRQRGQSVVPQALNASSNQGMNRPQPLPQVIRDPHLAFKQWSRTVQSLAQELPLCPKCQCPTPPTELERWSTCALCAARSST